MATASWQRHADWAQKNTCLQTDAVQRALQIAARVVAG
jgi:hypothetical protein